jgi:hypothetical protein
MNMSIVRFYVKTGEPPKLFSADTEGVVETTEMFEFTTCRTLEPGEDIIYKGILTRVITKAYDFDHSCYVFICQDVWNE